MEAARIHVRVHVRDRKYVVSYVQLLLQSHCNIADNPCTG
jgi:hypothetical protein